MNNLAIYKTARSARTVFVSTFGTTERPSFGDIYVSNLHITAQVIDDTTEKNTLQQFPTVGQKAAMGSLTDKAAWVGSEIAKKSEKLLNDSILFRGGKVYHGRVSALGRGSSWAEGI